jgi:hypothetical protein
LFLIQGYDRKREGDAAFASCEKQDPPPRPCVPAEEKWDEEGLARTRSLVSFGIAGALITTGIVLLVHAGPARQEASGELALLPWVGPRQLGVAGRF